MTYSAKACLATVLPPRLWVIPMLLVSLTLLLGCLFAEEKIPARSIANNCTHSLAHYAFPGLLCHGSLERTKGLEVQRVLPNAQARRLRTGQHHQTTGIMGAVLDKFVIVRNTKGISNDTLITVEPKPVPSLLEIARCAYLNHTLNIVNVEWISPGTDLFPDRHEVTAAQKRDRSNYYLALSVYTWMVALAFGTFLLCCRNFLLCCRDCYYCCCGWPAKGYKQMKASPDKGTDGSDFLSRVVGNRLTLFVVIATYLAFCMSLLYYCYVRGSIGKRFGVALEFWWIWQLMGLAGGLMEVLLLFARPGYFPVTLYAKAMVMSHLPVLSERVDTVKDLIFLAILAHAGWWTTMGLMLFILVASHVCFVYDRDVHGELLDTYLPISSSSPSQPYWIFSLLVHDDPRPDNYDNNGGVLLNLWLEIGGMMLKQASPARARISLLEDLPQGVGMAIFAYKQGGAGAFVYVGILMSCLRLLLCTPCVAIPIFRLFKAALTKKLNAAAKSGNASKVLSIARSMAWKIDDFFVVPQLKAVGFTAAELREEGLSTRQICLAGFTTSELKQGGYEEKYILGQFQALIQYDEIDWDGNLDRLLPYNEFITGIGPDRLRFKTMNSDDDARHNLGKDNITGSIAALTNCHRIDLDDCHNVRGDIAVFAGSAQLERLWLASTNVKGNIAALAGCTNLQSARLSRTVVKGDIAALATCTQLEHLMLQKSMVHGSRKALADLPCSKRRTQFNTDDTSVKY